MEAITVRMKNGKVVDYNMDVFMVDEEKQMVNLTKMAKPSGKSVADWMRLKSTNAFLKAWEKQDGNSHLGLEKLHGGIGHGTWAHREVAIEFAQWISPDFKVWCIKALDTLFQEGSVAIKDMPAAPVEEFYIPKTYAEALRLAADQTLKIEHQENQLMHLEAENEAQHFQIEELAPKAEIAEAILSTIDCMHVGTFAKVISDKIMEIGRNNLFIWFRENGYIMKYSTEPTQKSINLGLFVVKISERYSASVGTKPTLVTWITSKGQGYFLSKFMDLKESMDRSAAAEASEEQQSNLFDTLSDAQENND